MSLPTVLNLCVCVSVFSCVIQGAAEGPPVLLRARGDRGAEQPPRPHHRAGVWLSSGPGRKPHPGAEERGRAEARGVRNYPLVAERRDCFCLTHFSPRPFHFLPALRNCLHFYTGLPQRIELQGQGTPQC